MTNRFILRSDVLNYHLPVQRGIRRHIAGISYLESLVAWRALARVAEYQITRVLQRALVLAACLGSCLIQGCATLPPPVERPATHAIAASQETTLGRVAAASVPPGKGSGFRPLPLSAYSMDARLTLARQAQQSLDLQYYLLQNDVTGHTLLRAVRDAAL